MPVSKIYPFNPVFFSRCVDTVAANSAHSAPRSIFFPLPPSHAAGGFLLAMHEEEQLLPMPVDVLSIQSQVVYGCVGNNAAAPTLRAMGWHTLALPTVLLSNTPHYPSIWGGGVPQEWFEGWLRALHERHALHHLRAVLTGYLGQAGKARALAGWLPALLQGHSAPLVCIDPVLGDADVGLYVEPELAREYAALLPLADVLTPNRYELGLLTGAQPATPQQTEDAARRLLQGRTRALVVTSAGFDAPDAPEIHMLVVTPGEVRWLAHQRIAATPKGTGDMFSAALLGHMLRDADVFEAAAAAGQDVVRALERTAALRSRELVL